jgi:hypothetical protein
MLTAHRVFRFFVFMTLALAVVLFVAPLVALAQPVADGVVDVSPVSDTIIAAIGVVLTGLSAWITRLLAVWLRLKSDSEVRRYVQQAIDNGIEYALIKAKEFAAKHSQIEVKSHILETGLEYVVKAVPDGLKRLGITDADLRRLIEARLPTVEAAKL